MALRQLGIGLMRFLASQPAVDCYKALAGKVSRNETLARSFIRQGPGRTLVNLAKLIDDASRQGNFVSPTHC